MKIGKVELQYGAGKVKGFLKAKERLPNTLKLKGIDGKEKDILIGNYLNLYYRVNNFIVKHGRWPEYAEILGVSRCAAPMNFQDDKYSCGPASLSMASGMLFDFVSEQNFRAACGTSIDGTPPERLIKGAAKLGFKLTPIERNIGAVNNSLMHGRPVIAHIQTRPARCLGYEGDYGHYILIKQIIGNNYNTNDPTMGENKPCSPSILDRATNGRNIKYYSMSFL